MRCEERELVSFLHAGVDINTASKKELMQIKGIGSKKAEAIIAYREHNCFDSVDSLQKVKGIGKKFIQKHKEELHASQCHK